MSRHLVVLGTASQVPTRHRNHNGYLLRWEGEGVLFDPGEGTQRQMVAAGQQVSSISRICITHFHGDHCLGLPGVIQRLSLDGAGHPVAVYYPAGGAPFFERLRHASVFDDRADIRPVPVEAGEGLVTVDPGPPLRLLAGRLHHPTPTLGWRLEEPDARTVLPGKAARAGVTGAAVGELVAAGRIRVGGRAVALEDVSAPRPGQKMAFVMDTGPCDTARLLAEGVDLLVCEATFTEAERSVAEASGHMTAAQAARLAAEAGARRLVLTHFSQRHPDVADYLAEAAPHFPDVVAAHDLQVIGMPVRVRARG